MRQKIFSLTLFLFLASVSIAVYAQEAVKPLLISGDVTQVSASEIVMQTKDGSLIVVLSDKTNYKRASAEDTKKQIDAVASDISVGDKIIVSGFLSPDRKSIPARTVYLMTKADIAGKQNKDQEQWRTRGISGQVEAINPQTKEITVSSRGMAGATKVVLTAKADARFRRYAPDSIRYDEAKTSSLDELQVGDSIRALGDKSADGATFAAEEVVSGSFQTIGGTITAIDEAKNEITINDFKTKKPITVVVGQNTLMRNFPAEAAQRMAAMQNGGGMQPANGMRPPQANPNGGQTTPPQTPPNGQNAPDGTRPQGGFGGRMRGAGGIDEMLERFPPITIADLKVGEMVAFSSTKTVNQTRVTAIKFVSGIEPFVKAAQTTGTNTGGGRRSGADGGFTIPGLDGGF